MMRKIALALLTLSSLTPATLHARPLTEKAVTEAARASLPEWVEFLKLPNVQQTASQDLRRNAEWAAEAFKRHGFQAQLIGDDGPPAVFAEWPGASAARKTILFYAHLDGQAVDPKEWDQDDPFVPVLKQRDAAGAWQPIALERLQEAQPDWRLFARSAADDKAPIVMLMAAMDALRASGRKPSVNIKVLLDPEEESGSPALRDMVMRSASKLKADAIVMLDGPMHSSNKPTIVFGHRSVTTFRLTVYGPRSDLHSGHFGNFAPNPAQMLASLVASFKDGDGKVLVPGFYDGVTFPADVKSALAAVPDDEAAIRRRIGIAASTSVADTYQAALNYPSLNIIAMKSADIDTRRTIIPATATAVFDIRTVPATPGARQIALVRAFIEQQGWHLVDGAPTGEDRRDHPKLASLVAEIGEPALATPLDSAVGLWVRKALVEAFGEEPVRIPVMGGSVPSAPLVEGLKAPVLLLPLVNADNNQHAANENMRVGNYMDGVRSLYALLTQPY